MKLSEQEEQSQKRLCHDANVKMKEKMKTVMANYSHSKLSTPENMEELILTLEDKDKKIEELQNENQLLIADLNVCEDYITNQVIEMKKMAYYIDCLAQDSERDSCINGNRAEESAKTKRQLYEKLYNRKCTKSLQLKIDKYKTKLAKELENNKILSEQMKNEKLMRAKTEEALAVTKQMHDELLKQNQSLQCECQTYKKQSENVNYSQLKTETLEEFEQERNSFIEELQECRRYIKEQDDKINSLVKELELMNQEHAHWKNELKTTISNMRGIQNELVNSRQHFAFERMFLCSRIQELQKQVNQYECRIIQNNENNKVLLDTIQKEKAANTKLENAIKNVIKSDECLKQMLAQAKYTIRHITQKLEEYDIDRLEAQKHHDIKNLELQDRLLVADTTIQKLRENLDKMKNLMDKNVATRTLSAQLYESVNDQLTELQDTNEELSRRNKNVAEMYDYLKQVLYEKDKTFEEFRNQMFALKKELECEQKLREDTETALADAAATGDSELAQLRNIINAQNAQINQLNSAIQELQRTSLVGRLKSHIKRLEHENKDLRREVQKFVAYLKVILPGYIDPEELAHLKEKISNLENDVNQQKQEVKRQKKLREETTTHLKSKEEEHYQRIRDLIRENAELKRNKYKNGNSHSIILLAKENKEDGDVKYRCLYGAETKKKTSPEIHSDDVNKLQQLERAQEEINRLKNQTVNDKEKITKLEQYLKVIEATDVKKLKQDLEAATDEITVLTKQLANLETLKTPEGETPKVQTRQLVTPKTETVNVELPIPTIDKTCEAEREKLLNEITSQKKEISELLGKINKPFSPNQNDEQTVFILKENENLKKYIQELESQLENVRSKLEKAESEYQKNFINLKPTFKMKAAHVKELETLCRQLQDDGETFKLRIEELQKEKPELKKDDKLKSNRDLLSPVDTIKGDQDFIEKDLENWKNNVHNVLEDMTNNIANVKDPDYASNVVSNIQKITKDFEDAIVKKSDNIRSGVNEGMLQELKKQLAKLYEENIALKDKIRDLEERDGNNTVSLPEDIKELQKKLLESTDKNNSLQAEVQRLRSQRMSTVSQGNSQENFQKNIPKQSQLVEESEQRLLELQRNYDTDVGKLKAQIQLLTQNQPEGQTTTMNNLQENLEKPQETIEKVENANANLGSQNSLFRSQFDEKELSSKDPENDKMLDLVEHLRLLEKKNENLKSRTIQLELDNGRLKADLENLIADKDGEGYQKVMQRLRDLERTSKKCQEKYQVLKKRSVKLEIENKNTKKEYISVLIEKEKFLLQSHEQTRRLRETNKLLRKAQDKKSSLADRTVKLQVENDSLKKQLDSLISKELAEHFGRFKDTDNELENINNSLKQENKHLRDLVQQLSNEAENNEVVLTPELQDFLKAPKNEDLRFKIIQLELANEKLTEELHKLKSTNIESLDNEIIERRLADDLNDFEEMTAIQKARMETVELQIENEYLKHELAAKEKALQDANAGEKQLNELEETIHQLQEGNENLQRVTVELELDNEYLRKELENMEKIEGTSNIGSKTMEKQNNALKMTIDKLEKQVKDLKQQIDELGKAQITLEAHTQQSLIGEIDRLLTDYEEKLSSNDDVQSVKERLSLWKKEYKPQVLSLRQDLDQLTEQKCVEDLRVKLQDAMAKNQQLQYENENMENVLGTLLNNKAITTNKELLAQVELQLQKHDSQSSKKLPTGEEQRIKEIEEQLKECKDVNQKLRNMKVSLESHMQSEKIKQLEDMIRRKSLPDDENTTRPVRSRSIYDNVDIIKIKKLEEQLQEQQETHYKTVEELEKLRVSITELKSHLKIAQNNIDQLNLENERCKKINELNIKLKSDLEKQLQDMRHELTADQVLKDKKLTFGKVQELEDQIANIKKEYLELHAHYEENLKRIAELEAQLKKCQDKNKDLKKHLLLNSSPEDINDNVTKNYPKDDKRSKSDNDSESELDFEDAEPGEQKTDKNTENQLLEAQYKIKLLKEDLVRLHQANIILQNDAKKVAELEERLMESDVKLESAQDEIKRLQNDKLSLEKRRHKFSEIENELKESQRIIEVYKTKMQLLGEELALQEDYLDENKYLKEEINSFIYKLNACETDNKILEDEINRLTVINENLLKKNDEYRDEITTLRNQIQFLGGGENATLSEQLDAKNEENEKLKLVISDLQKQIDSVKLELEGGKGDVDERVMHLQEKLWKYRDNNEYLKKKIAQLETEKITLVMNLNTYPDVNAQEICGEKKQDLDDCQLKKKQLIVSASNEVMPLESQESRLEEVKKEIQKCQDENKNLKSVTLQLEAEIKSLKKDLNQLISKESKKKANNLPAVQSTKSKEEKSVKSKADKENNECSESKLKQHKRNWKNVVSKLAEQCQENINVLHKKLEPLAPANIIQPWMIQPQVLHPGYTTMPLLMQPMVNYEANTNIEKEMTCSDDDVQKLAEIIDKIKITLDKSKRAKQSKIVKDTNDFEDEEQEEKLLDYNILNPQNEMDAPSSDVEEKIAELDKQILKQHQAKEKIEKLQNEIKGTMKNLKELSQKNKGCTGSSEINTDVPGPSAPRDSQFGSLNKSCTIDEKKYSVVKPSQHSCENDSFDSL